MRRSDEVYRAAIDLFVEHGFENTTIDQIADRADVARATVFNHFKRKTTFLDEWSTRRRRRAAGAIADHDTEEWPVDRILKQYMAEMARLSFETRDETIALMNACLHHIDLLRRPRLGDEFAGYILAAQELGEVRAEVDSHQVGVVLAAGYFSVLTEWIDEPESFDLEVSLLALVDLILGGILAPDRRRGVEHAE